MLRPGLLVLLIAAATAGGPAAPPADRPPELLWQPALNTPAETAGSGEAPEVRVRIHVTPTGAVDRVEVLEVRPPGRHDRLFREEAVRTLSRWRFRPAIKSGQPAEATLAWTIRFTPFSGELPPGVEDAAPLHFPEDDADDYRRTLLMLPEAQRARLLDQLVGSAEAQIETPNRSEFRAPGFVVVTDAPRPGFAAQVLGNVQAVYHFGYDVFREKIQDQPAHGPLWVFVFRSSRQYAEFARRNKAADWTTGFYNPAGIVAFYAEDQTPAALASILIHETTHAMVDRHIVRPGILLPRWLDEGFAQYMDLSDIEQGRIIAGGHRKKWILQRIGGNVTWSPTGASIEIDKIKKTVREGQAFTVRQLVQTDAAHFYGEQHDLYYAQSYLLVHFLRHGRPSWATEEFPRFVLYVAEGYPPEDSFRRVYGQAPEAFETEYEAYIKRF